MPLADRPRAGQFSIWLTACAIATDAMDLALRGKLAVLPEKVAYDLSTDYGSDAILVIWGGVRESR
jgi:hypothetical protein